MTERRFSPLLALLIAIPVILLVVVLALPSLLSSGPALRWALDRANQNIPGSIALESLSLSWLGGQSLRQLSVRDPEGATVLSLSRLDTELTLLQALRQQLTLGETVISGLRADITVAEDGSNNLLRALGSGDAAEPSDTPLLIPITGNMRLEDTQLTLRTPGQPTVTINDVTLTATLAPDTRALASALRAAVDYDGLSGTVQLDATAENWLDSRGQLTMDSAVFNADARLNNVPVVALDRLAGMGGVLEAALGDPLNAQFTLKDSALLTSLNTPLLKLALQGNLADGLLTLSEPGDVSWQMTPQLIAKVASDSGMTLLQAVTLRARIDQLQLPLGEPNPSAVRLAASINTDRAIALQLEGADTVRIEGLQAKLSTTSLTESITADASAALRSGDDSGQLALRMQASELFDSQQQLQPQQAKLDATLDIAALPTALVDRLSGGSGMLPALLGATVQAQAQARNGDDGRIAVQLQAQTPTLRLEPMQLSVGERLDLQQPATLRYRLTPAAVSALAAESALSLQSPTDLTLRLERLSAPMPGEDGPALRPADTRVNLTLSGSPLTLVDAEGASQRLSELNLSLGGDSLAAMTFDLSALLQAEGGALAGIVGEGMNITAEGRSGLSDELGVLATEVNVAATAGEMRLQLPLRLSQGLSRLSLGAPGELRLPVTPALVAALSEQITLQAPTTLQATISALDLPLSEEGSGRVALDLRSGDIALRTGQENLTISQLAVALESQDLRREASLNATARLSGGRGGDGALRVNGKLTDLLGPEGLDLEQAAWALEANAEPLPVAFIDQWLDTDGLAQALLGATATASLNSTVSAGSGPVRIQLNGSNTRLDLNAQWEQGTLLLRETLVAELQATPEVGRALLGKAHPLFSSLQGGEQPIRLTVPAEGFALPITEFALDAIRIPEIRLEPGVMTLETSPLLEGLIALANRVGKGAGPTGTGTQRWRAEFTPALLSMAEGRIAYQRRLDLLLGERMHLATWGEIDLNRQRTDLVLAVMPHTLQDVFGLRSDEALRIPVQGGLDGRGVNYSAVAVELGRLQAQRRGGNAALLGALAGALAGGGSAASGGNEPLPAPSVDPLPFAERLAQRAAERAAEPEAAATEPASEAEAEAEAPAERSEQRPEEAVRDLINIIRKR